MTDVDVDSVKVDIEGSEPLLVTDLRNLATHAQVWLVEFGFQASKSDNHKLLEAFLNQRFMAWERDGSFVTSDKSEAKEFLDRMAKITDLYFIREDLRNGR